MGSGGRDTGRLDAGAAGTRYLLDAGLTPIRSHDRPSPLHLWHLLALNDALIAFEVLCRTDPRLTLERVQSERLLRQLAPRVTLPDGRTTTVVPDAWVDLVIAHEAMGIALELDRGTEEERQWRRKIAALLALAAGPYRAAFDADSMTVAVLATSGERRATVLRRWTESELTDCGKEHWGELFGSRAPIRR
jgi:Replication-relaxation